MGVHSCSPYCDIDERFHDLLKYEMDEASCYMGKDELMTELLKKRQELDELIMKLAQYNLSAEENNCDD